MSKFIKLLKEALSLKPDNDSENIVNKMDGLNNKLQRATLDGEDHWHLCWERKHKCKCEEDKNNVD